MFLVLFRLTIAVAVAVFTVVHDEEVLEECIVELLIILLTLVLDEENEDDVSVLPFVFLGDCGLSRGCELLDEIEDVFELDAE